MREVSKPDAPKRGFTSRVIGAISPKWELNREKARRHLQIINNRFEHARPTRTSDGKLRIDGGMDGDDLEAMRQRAQGLDDNNAIANGLLDRCVENVVHTGIRPQAMTKDKDWNEKAEAKFTEWADFGADVRQLETFWGLQRQAFRSYKRDGDSGCILLKSGAIQLIESEDIETPVGESGNARIVEGVELGRNGAPRAFHIAEEPLNGARSWERVPARDFVYMLKRRSSKDTRGEPAFAQTANLFDQVDGLMESVVTAAQMAANFGLLIQNGDGEIETLGQTKDAAGNAAPEFELEPGMVRFTTVQGEVTQVKPEQPSTNYVDFLASTLRMLGLPFGIPLELLMLDFSRTNYSSARASLLQAYRTFQGMQEVMRVWNARIYRWRISKWIKAGELPEVESPWAHQWIMPGWMAIDPIKEAVANMIALDGGWETLARITTNMGNDWRDILAQRKTEIDVQRTSGIPINMSKQTRTEGEGETDGETENETPDDD